ncbi:MAG TPA: bifunctional precorrin-2 dehydrogenase/sirohydrochlorin ferrochelatase [Actinobacteria bacterium]|nr:bifunctional precorrin-2 dehydrogenase/sirohydrochlorin ferrochelatase [Actinomycetota bacterium]
MDGRLCTIVGGGRVAFRKASALAECGARLRVVAPALAPEFQQLKSSLEHIDRLYAPGDLEGSFLVIAATDDEQTNRAVEAEARAGDIPLNVVDRPEQCDFYVPASVQRGDLMLTVSTGGQSPALAKRLRRQLEQEFPGEWSEALELLGAARREVIARIGDEERKRRCLTGLAELDLVSILRSSGREAAQAEIEQCISRY